jgi:acid phosphatase
MLQRTLTALAAGTAVVGLAAAGVSVAGVAGAAVKVPKASGPCGTLTTAPTIKHVVLIMEENHSYNTIIGPNTGAPYINSLAKACGLATAFHNITHPSLPNYIAITSATALSALGPFESDCNPGGSCLSKSQSLFSQVGASGWKAYDETMPSPCYGTTKSSYAPKHNPAIYYTDIPAATCKANDLPLGTLSSSPFLKAFASESTAPKLTVVTPNLNDDMHDGTVAQGDTWLKNWMTKLIATSVYRSGDTAVFIIWDEGENGSYSIGEACAKSPDVSCHVAAIVVAPSVPAKSVSTAFTHYSFVRTVEALFKLPTLNQAGSAASMVSAFHL